ncbi:hypothetical protein FRACA_2190001 [Frankia canadensis]|uniref:Uncharacterized protein n=1 Tax=Frankia canadensis TaxID=1836972 RepID=A0A2I2KQW4_9ACTN|nr:hypothetical protein FRACA_2190001 [Frankia canadensis]SOU55342.1 hypothetical protein FRACA_2190001 [Frankia canadensis]
MWSRPVDRRTKGPGGRPTHVAGATPDPGGFQSLNRDGVSNTGSGTTNVTRPGNPFAATAVDPRAPAAEKPGSAPTSAFAGLLSDHT